MLIILIQNLKECRSPFHRASLGTFGAKFDQLITRIWS